MLACTNCGNENREGARYCRYCGQTLGPAASEGSSLPEEGEAAISLPDIPYAGEAEIFDGLGESPTVLAGPEPDSLVVEQAPQIELAEAIESVGEPVEAGIEVVSDEHLLPIEADTVPDTEEGTATPEQAAGPEETQAAEQSDDSEAAFGAFLAGVLLGGRYRVLGLEAEDPEFRLYRVEDLLSCWSCSAEQSDFQQQYCETCGAEQVEKPQRLLRAYLADQAPADAPECFSEAGYCFCLEALPVEPAPAAAPVLRASAGFRTHPGLEREINEDSLLALQLAALCGPPVLPVVGLFAVADGIGGNEAGEIASQAAVYCLAEEAMRNIFPPALSQAERIEDDPEARLKQAAQAANRAILELRRQSEAEINMGCTLTAALVWGSQAYVVNAGDSRTYLLRAGQMEQVTRDHSVVARLVEQGYISKDEGYTHDQKSVIYRSLGDRPDLEIDTFRLDLLPGDRLLLCSDGLWEMVRDPLIEEVLLERFDPQQACDRLVEMANRSGGEDNISVVVVNLDALT